MKQPQPAPGADTAKRLASVRARLEATLQEPSTAMSGGLAGLEADVASICSMIPNLPAAEAQGLAAEMKHVIGLLELLSKAMAERAEAGADGTGSVARHRQAAAAYGAGRKHRP